MADVVAGVEADVVGAEDPAQELAPRRQQAVDLGGRERDVQEEADREVGPARCGARAGSEREVEVVDPDREPRRGDGSAIVSANRSLTAT